MYSKLERLVPGTAIYLSPVFNDEYFALIAHPFFSDIRDIIKVYFLAVLLIVLSIIESGALKSPTVVELSVSPFNSVFASCILGLSC